MRYWIIPNDGALFKTEKALAMNNGLLDWRAGNRKFVVGDIVFLYKSKSESCIRYMLKVVKTDIEGKDAFDQKSCWTDYQNQRRREEYKYVRLELLHTIQNDNLKIANLRKHGLLGNLQGAQTCSGELLAFILSEFEK